MSGGTRCPLASSAARERENGGGFSVSVVMSLMVGSVTALIANQPG
jgi:hypothetical protein